MLIILFNLPCLEVPCLMMKRQIPLFGLLPSFGDSCLTSPRLQLLLTKMQLYTRRLVCYSLRADIHIAYSMLGSMRWNTFRDIALDSIRYIIDGWDVIPPPNLSLFGNMYVVNSWSLVSDERCTANVNTGLSVIWMTFFGRHDQGRSETMNTQSILSGSHP